MSGCLDVQWQLPENKEGAPSRLQDVMRAIRTDASVKDPDKELAALFHAIVNPNNIPDGHCSKCAFNTHIYLIGGKLQEAEDVNTAKFVEFSHWFYRTFSPEVVTCHRTVAGKEGERFAEFQKRVAEAVKSATEPGEAVLISICQGAHWFNAYNDGERIWFIDAQGGKGFNLYLRNGAFNPNIDAWVDIVKVDTCLLREGLLDRTERWASWMPTMPEQFRLSAQTLV